MCPVNSVMTCLEARHGSNINLKFIHMILRKESTFGGFPKWGYPPIIQFHGIFHDVNHLFWVAP